MNIPKPIQKLLPIHWTIRLRLTIWSVVTVTVFLLLFSTFVYWATYYFLEQSEESVHLSDAKQVVDIWTQGHDDPLQKLKSIKELFRSDARVRIINPLGAAIAEVSIQSEEPIPPVKSQYQQSLQINLMDIHDQTILVVRYPFVDQGILYTLEIVSSLRQMDRSMHILVTVLSVGSGILLVMMGIGSYFFARTALRPVNRIIDSVNQLDPAHLTGRVAVPPAQDEIADLAHTFNGLLGKAEIVMKQQSQFVADASHELRTPLTVIHGYANLLRRWGKNDPAVLDESIDSILKEADRLKKLVNQLLELDRVERDDGVQLETMDIRQLIHELADEWHFLVGEKGRLTIDLPKDAAVHVKLEPLAFSRVMTVLLENAIAYRRDVELAIEVKLTVKSVYGFQQACVSVTDNGRGIAAEELPHIFDRFYRVEKSRSSATPGSGIGLSIAKHLVERMQGQIRVKSMQGQGSTFEICLPVQGEYKGVDSE